MKLNLYVFACIVSSVKGQWISPITPLPKADCDMSIGFYQGIISMLGGDQSKFDLMEYNVSNQSFNILKNRIPETAGVLGVNQYWTQINDMLYMIDATGKTINVYDLSNKVFTIDWVNISLSVFYNGCLASANNKLYVIDYTQQLQILDIVNMSWSFGPKLNGIRQQFSCIASSEYQKLYVIGGGNGNGILSTIEWISTANIELNQWKETYNNLNSRLSYSRAVIYHKYVYIIGGFSNADVTITSNEINAIDMSTNTVFLWQERLAYNVAAVSPIAIHGKLFAFGGIIHDDSVIDQWQYYKFNTENIAKAGMDYRMLMIIGISCILLIVCCIICLVKLKKIRRDNNPMHRQLFQLRLDSNNDEDLSLEIMFGK